MSIKLMTKVWENGPEDRTETIVLLALADRANDDGSSCFPSIAEVKQRARLSRRGTQKVIRRLEEKGFLTVHENQGPGGTNNYKLHPPKLEGRTDCTGEGEHDSPGGEPDDEKGRSTFARNRQEPSKNRQGDAPACESGEGERIDQLLDIRNRDIPPHEVQEADKWQKKMYKLAHPDYDPVALTVGEWEQKIDDPVAWAKAIMKGLKREWEPQTVDAREDHYEEVADDESVVHDRIQNGKQTARSCR